MILGLLPAAGGSIHDLRLTGQHTRLLDGYFRFYASTFAHTYYFSYADEILADYTEDAVLLGKILVRPRRNPRLPYRLYSLILPFVYAADFRHCSVLRVFQATGAAPAIVSRWRYGTPYVVTYGYRYPEFARAQGHNTRAVRLAQIERLALRHADAVIVTTKQLQQHVCETVPSELVHLIPNGVDVARFRTAQEEAADRPPTVVFVGRLERQKNLVTLIRAMSLLQSRPQPRLVVIGGGSLNNQLQAQAQRLGVCAEFLGNVDHSLLPSYLQSARAFVLPSLIEGHPKALLEAMACGLPCIVSDCEGNREMVTDGQNGLLFPVDDARALAAQIDRILSDHTLAHTLGVQARDLVVREYALNELLQREVDLLQSVAR